MADDKTMRMVTNLDRKAIEGETRRLVQVGLQAAASRGGRRPAMNIALVLDARHDIPPALCGDLANRPVHDLGERNPIAFLRGQVLTGRPLLTDQPPAHRAHQL